MCVPLMKLFRLIFGSCRQRGGRCGKKPENFLTPYEMDMVPLMLKELDDLDHRFYQMVCYRWFKDALLIAKQQSSDSTDISDCQPSSSSSASSTTTTTSTTSTTSSASSSNNCNLSAATTSSTSTTTSIFNKNGTLSFEEFVNEGQVLRHLIRFLSRTLRDTGTFDEECEAQLAAYRLQRQQWHVAQFNANLAKTMREQMMFTRSISTTVAAPLLPSAANRHFILNSSASTTLTQSTAATSPSLPVLEEDDYFNSHRSVKSRRNSKIMSQAIQRVRAVTIAAAEPLNLVPDCRESQKSIKQLKRRSCTSLKHRRAVVESIDALFTQLGENLIHQYHTTVIVDGNQRLQNENVHERELKVLIWRHFVQMFVAILTDRVRFPV